MVSSVAAGNLADGVVQDALPLLIIGYTTSPLVVASGLSRTAVLGVAALSLWFESTARSVAGSQPVPRAPLAGLVVATGGSVAMGVPAVGYAAAGLMALQLVYRPSP